MCGIAGAVGLVDEASRQRVMVMGDAIAHRGPDDSGSWSDQSATLVHRRLSIIDVSASGHQPMLSFCGRYVLVFNGEIYNYRELKEELINKGIAFQSHSDTEVLLASFATWGESCVTRFNGMWAFAIWDRNERRLFVSRDRFGEKPFYYVLRDGTFWFASEIKALLEAGIASRAVNPQAVADFAAERVSDHSAETFFAEVRQLPPATSGWVDGVKLAYSTYWSIPEEDYSSNEATSAEEIAHLLEDAIRIRLRSDVPVGVLLSGGLDSSSVSCLAAQLSTEPLAAFSTIDRAPPDEAAGIQAVLDANPGLLLHRDEPPDDCLEKELMHCLWHQEEPFADGSMLAHFRLMRLAHDKGVHVLLTGQAADEVFGGYPGFLAVHLGGLLRRGALGEARSFHRHWSETSQDLSIRSVLGQALPARLGALLRRRKSHGALDWLARDWQAVSRSVSAGYTDSQSDSLNGALRACLKQRTLPAFLHYEDRNSMSVGVETRIPFLDHRLVEKVLPIAGSRKLDQARTKALLRIAVADRVPSSIVQRLAKDGYPAPLVRWMRRSSPGVLADWREAVHSCPFIQFGPWDKRWQRLMAGDDAELPMTWRGLILSLWYRQYVAVSA